MSAPRPGPTNNLQTPVLESLRPDNNKIGTQPHPLEDRLPKVFLSPQPPQNTALDMVLPIRGIRLSSTHQRAGTSPSHQVGGNVNWCSHYGKQYGGFSKN